MNINYIVVYANAKSNEEDEPSAETLSVVVRPSQPPKSRTSPEGSPQQRCSYLFSSNLTDSEVKVEVPSNFSQDLLVVSLYPGLYTR